VGTVHRILTHPAYAGTYAYGRTPIEPERRRNGQPGLRRAPMAEWAVTLHDRVPAYISWEHYLRHVERLRPYRTTAKTRGTARQGIALLSGLVFCGRCGRRKVVPIENALRRPIGCYERLRDFPRMRSLVVAGVAAGQTAEEIADCLNRGGFHSPSYRVDRFTPELARVLVYRLASVRGVGWLNCCPPTNGGAATWRTSLD
jgi:hypothetical protein